MTAIRLPNGTIEKNSHIIVKEQIKFYEQLYTKDDAVSFKRKAKSNKILTKEQGDSLETSLSIDELGLALKDSKRNKSPGPDGLMADFYMMFWNKLKFIIFEAFQDSFCKGKLYVSARRGIITLIPKKGRDILEVKNWRPICLLNADYKILSKALAHRLKGVLLAIIHEDQNGFVPGRNIAYNTRKALDLIRYAELRKLQMILVSVHFEKAFDRVDYQAMNDILEYFGVGTYFRKWISLLFNQFYLATTNAGYMSHYITPTRGLFQGNPIASFLFVMIVEVLAQMLRNATDIQTIEIKSFRYLLSQFVDDLDLFMKFDSYSFNRAIDIIQQFCSISDMKINVDKTTIYRIGSIRHSNAKFYTQHKIKWSDKPVNLLGIN